MGTGFIQDEYIFSDMYWQDVASPYDTTTFGTAKTYKEAEQSYSIPMESADGSYHTKRVSKKEYDEYNEKILGEETERFLKVAARFGV